MNRHRATLAAVVFAAAACGPTVHVTNLGGTFPPRRAADELTVFSTKVPECPYGELGIVTAYRSQVATPTAMDEALDLLKERARSLGADAVVGLRVVSGGGGGGEAMREGYSATAIRFTDEACTH